MERWSNNSDMMQDDFILSNKCLFHTLGVADTVLCASQILTHLALKQCSLILFILILQMERQAQRG